MCATVGTNLDVPGKWNATTKKWELLDKWDVLTDHDKFKTDVNLRLLLKEGKPMIVQNH